MRTFLQLIKKIMPLLMKPLQLTMGGSLKAMGLLHQSDDMDSIEQIEVEESDGQMYLQLDGDSDTGNITERSDGRKQLA